MSKTRERDISPAAAHPGAAEAEEFSRERRRMVEEQLREREVTSPRVLEAMLAVPRHAFVPADLREFAYCDEPLAIGEGQTISQPFMVAAMTEALELTGGEHVLEIGTGSGYQAAVVSRLAAKVFTVESHELLAAAARARLEQLGYANVEVHVGDGTLGLPEAAPFDAILVTAAAPGIPPPLLEQLAEGGRLVIPVGSPDQQELLQVRRSAARVTSRVLHHCRFVPLVGRHGWPGANRG
jgi:protein-L-isoaspartate(D-aspartate) O-methyltransferase